MVLGPISNTTPTPAPGTTTAPAADAPVTAAPEAPKTEGPAIARDGSAVEAKPGEIPDAGPVNLDQVVVPPVVVPVDSATPPPISNGPSSAPAEPSPPPAPPPVPEPPHPPLVPVDSPTPPPVVDGPPCPTEEPPAPPKPPEVQAPPPPPPTPAPPPEPPHPPVVPVDSPTPPPVIDGPPCPTEPPKPVEPPKPPTVTSEPPKPPVKPPVKPTPKPTPKPHVAKGRSFATQGDPIIKTGDGLQFSINKPGKYTSLKSANGDFLMQQEVSKTKDNRHYNTAFGFQIGKDKLAFDTHGGKGMATLKVNGKEVKLGFSPVSMKLPDGGTLKYDPKTNKIHLHTPQGDDITVQRTMNAAKTHYLNVKLDMAESRPAGSVRGVLGNMDEDGDAKNDAVMRDGKPFTGAIGSLWKTPEKFIDEWRSRPDENVL
jgi:hypothetical protein